MIIPPMGGDHFGMGPGAQHSSVAEIAIFRFFRPIFVLLLAPPFLVNGTGRYLIKDSQGVEGSNRIEKSRIAQLLRKLDPKNQKTRFLQ